MLYKNLIVQNDLKEMLEDKNISWEKLKDSSVLITGGTGMLAKYITYLLIYMNEKMNYNITICVLVRNLEKAVQDFGEYIALDYLRIINQDICNKIEIDYKVDYIIHAAGSCSAYCIKKDPIGIIDANTIIANPNIIICLKDQLSVDFLFTSIFSFFIINLHFCTLINCCLKIIPYNIRQLFINFVARKYTLFKFHEYHLIQQNI